MAQNSRSPVGIILYKIRKGMIKMLRCYMNMPRIKRALLEVGLVMLIIGVVAGTAIGKTWSTKKAKKEIAAVTTAAAAKIELTDKKEEKKKTPADIPWNLALVNTEHPMAPDYVPKLVAEETYSVDERVAEAAKEMLEAAKKEGLGMVVCSSYRDMDKQKEIFNTTVADHLAEGVDYWTAYDNTKQSVALPGTSEHGMGMALDIVSSQYELLDEAQADTKEAKWLEQNCYKYGFILRYPPEKTAETGIIYEPWHYRYVGKEDAKIIMESKTTLEMYLKDNYGM